MYMAGNRYLCYRTQVNLQGLRGGSRESLSNREHNNKQLLDEVFVIT